VPPAPGSHGDDGALRVVLAGEEHLGFQLFEQLGVGLELSLDVASMDSSLAGELEQRVEVGS